MENRASQRYLVSTLNSKPLVGREGWKRVKSPCLPPKNVNYAAKGAATPRSSSRCLNNYRGAGRIRRYPGYSAFTVSPRCRDGHTQPLLT